MIESVVKELEVHKRFDFRLDGQIRIHRMPVNRALEFYKNTLGSIIGSLEGEPPSATMVQRAMVSWRAEPADIGMKVRQTHVGEVHEEMIPLVDKWVKAGKPYPSSGGFFYTIPNKSYERVRDLAKVPELRDAVLRLGIEEEWLRFWETYLQLRYDVSRQLLDDMLSGRDPEALSRHNELAGTGLHIRGRRQKREDLITVAKDLEFLLPYSFAMGVAFAAVQLAPLEPHLVWVIEVYDKKIRGAIASRSDMDVYGVEWDGARLTIEGVTQTRQAGSDCTGVLANSYTERRIMGHSVGEAVVRETKHPRVDYPFTDKNLLLDIWAADAKPFPGKQYVIGQDFGLTEPVKAPADSLFSRGFVILNGRWLPLMVSGSGWTQPVYSVFHNHFASKLAPTDRMEALGDDMNVLTDSTEEAVFEPYIKVKSTDPTKNHKKILGQMTAFSPKPDPLGQEEALIGVVPRVIRTVSSATKRSGYWGDRLARLPEKADLDLEHDPAILEVIKQDLPVLLPYMQWSGPRNEFRSAMLATWGSVSPGAWELLRKYNPEIEHRITPEGEPDVELPTSL